MQDIAAHFDMARPSVSEHLKVLLDAGLVTEQRDGRRRLYEVRADPLLRLADWLTPYGQRWNGRLAGLHGVGLQGVLEDGGA